MSTSKNYDKVTAQQAKADFIKKAKDRRQSKSYFDRHYKNYTASYWLKFLLSVVSSALALVAVIAFLMASMGIDETLMNFTQNNTTLFISCAAVSFAILAAIEYGKHNFWNDHFEEKQSNSDDNGQGEYRIALVLSLLSLTLSGLGGYLSANEFAGSKQSAKLTALEAEYKPLIADKATKLIKYNGSEFKNTKGKTLYKIIPTIRKLENEKASLEATFIAAKQKAGLEGFAPTSAKASNLLMFLFIGVQFLIELALYFIIKGRAYFTNRVAFEENTNDNDTRANNTHTQTIYHTDNGNSNTDGHQQRGLYSNSQIGFKYKGKNQTNNVPLPTKPKTNNVPPKAKVKYTNFIVSGTKECTVCGIAFTSNSPRHVFCSATCRSVNHKRKLKAKALQS